MAGNPRARRRAVLTRGARRTRRGRPICRMRGRARGGCVEPARGTTLKWKNEGGVQRSSTSLVHVLRELAGHVTPRAARVHIDVCTRVLWNTVTVQRQYGDTRVRVRRANGRVAKLRLRDIAPAAFTTATRWADRIVRLRVLEVKINGGFRDEVRAELLHSLATTQHGGKVVLGAMKFRDLEILWTQAGAMKSAQQRERARGRLSKHSLKRFGVSLLARPRVRIPMNTVFPRNAMVRAVKRLFVELGGGERAVVDRLQRRTRYVAADPVRVGDGMCNWRKWCRDEYVPGAQPKCT